MKQKLIVIFAIGLLMVVAFSKNVLAAEGDAWIIPTNQNVGVSEHFDIAVYMDTGGKDMGAFNLDFNFATADVNVDTSLGINGVSKGTDATSYTIMSDTSGLANGSLRFSGIATSNYANGDDVYLVTIHCVSTSNFVSGTSNLTLNINELYDQASTPLTIGTATGASIIYPVEADLIPPVLSAGVPSGILSAGTTTATMTLTTNEAATCKYGTTSGVVYDSIANTFTTTGGTSQSQSLTGLTNGTSYSYYIRCEDGSSNQSTRDYTINFSVAEVTPTCTSFIYSDWGSCQSDKTQTRTLVSSSPSGCEGGTPVLSQSCVYEEVQTDDEADNINTDDEETILVKYVKPSISAPHIQVYNFIKEKLKSDEKFYSRKKEFSFKGEDKELAGGTVKVYKGSKLEDKSDVSSKGEWKLKIKEKENKTYTYKIKYYDSNDNKIKSKEYKIKVDSEDPEFTDLPNKLFKKKNEAIWWKAKDNDEVDEFKVYFDGKKYKINSPKNRKDEEVTVNFVIPANTVAGIHNMQIRVYDEAGNKESRDVEVMVR